MEDEQTDPILPQTELDFFNLEAADGKIEAQFDDHHIEVVPGDDGLDATITKDGIQYRGNLKFNGIWTLSILPEIGVGPGQTVVGALIGFINYL